MIRRLARMRVTAVGVFVAIAVLAALPVGAAQAADGEVTWSVQPSSPTGPDGRTRFEYTVAAGTVVTDWVAITNFSDIPVDFSVYAADGINDYDEGFFTLAESREVSADLGSWITLNDLATQTVTLQPGVRTDVPVTIAVPSDATPGDHAAGIIAAVSTPAAEGTVLVHQRVAARVYLRVDGAITPSVGIAGFTAGFSSPLNPFGGGAANADFELENRGNVRVNVNHRLEIAGPFGLAPLVLAEDTVENLLPGQTIHIEADAASVPPLLMLFATATAQIVAADEATEIPAGSDTVTAGTVAWAIPWTLLLVLAVAVGIIALVVWQRRRYRRAVAFEFDRAVTQARADALALARRTARDLDDDDIVDAELVDDDIYDDNRANDARSNKAGTPS